jgi:hypothetical protein
MLFIAHHLIHYEPVNATFLFLILQYCEYMQTFVPPKKNYALKIYYFLQE